MPHRGVGIRVTVGGVYGLRRYAAMDDIWRSRPVAAAATRALPQAIFHYALRAYPSAKMSVNNSILS